MPKTKTTEEAAIIDPIALTSVIDGPPHRVTVDRTDLLMLLGVAFEQLDEVRDDETAQAYGFGSTEDTQMIANTAERLIAALNAGNH